MHTPSLPHHTLLLLFSCFVALTPAKAQYLKFGVGGGLAIFSSTGSNEGVPDKFTLPVTKGGYGFGPRELWLGAKVKYTPLKANISFTADFEYTSLEGNGQYNIQDPSHNTPYIRTFKSDLYTIAVGAQWNFLRGPLRPYAGLDVLWTSLSEVQESNSWGYDVLIYGKTGFNNLGLGIVAGTEMNLTSRMALDVTARYSFPHLFYYGDLRPYSFNTLTLGVEAIFGAFN